MKGVTALTRILLFTSIGIVVRMALVTGIAGVHGVCRAETTEWPSNLDDVSLRALPHVHSVTSFPVVDPKRRIIHIVDQHYLPRSEFVDEMKRAGLPVLFQKETDRQYDAFMDMIEAIQDDQLLFLQSLVKKHDVRAIYLEGLPRLWTSKEIADADRYNEHEKRIYLRRLPADHKSLRALWSKRDIPEDETLRGSLRLRAGGRLFLSGDLAEIRGVEPVLEISEQRARDAVRPDDERWAAINEKREDGIVKALLKGDPVAIVILGLGHDLSDKIKRLSGNSCEYIRVETRVSWEKRDELEGVGRIADQPSDAN